MKPYNTSLMLLMLSFSADPVKADDTSVYLDRNSSFVEFKAVGNPSALVILGKGAGIDGELKFSSGGHVDGKAILDLTTLNTGIGLRDSHLKNKYLEVERHKHAEFRPQKVHWRTAADVYMQPVVEQPFSGLLKIRNIEKHIEGTMTSVPKDGKAEATFSFKVSLQDFDIPIPSFAGITVAKDVEVKVMALLQKDKVQ